MRWRLARAGESGRWARRRAPRSRAPLGSSRSRTLGPTRLRPTVERERASRPLSAIHNSVATGEVAWRATSARAKSPGGSAASRPRARIVQRPRRCPVLVTQLLVTASRRAGLGSVTAAPAGLRKSTRRSCSTARASCELWSPRWTSTAAPARHRGLPTSTNPRGPAKGELVTNNAATKDGSSHVRVFEDVPPAARLGRGGPF